MEKRGLKSKATSKNVIPAKAGIHKFLILLDSRLRGSDKLGIIRGCRKSIFSFERAKAGSEMALPLRNFAGPVVYIEAGPFL